MTHAGVAGPKVLLDATAIPADRGGVGRYVDGYVAAYAAARPGDLAIACQLRDAEHFRAMAPDAVIVAQDRSLESTARRFLWEQTGLPRLAARLRVGVIHSPHYTVPLVTRARRVVTFHDATFFSDPAVHTRTKGLFFRAWIRIASRLARAVIVPSASAGEELARYARRPRALFTVAHHGVDADRFHPPTPLETETFAARVGMAGRRWIAFLGTVEPRKNLPALLAAHEALSIADSSTPALLVAGGRGWDAEADRQLARTDRVGTAIRLGFVDAEELRALLGGSEIVAYPSLGEGFGLPVLEAMACGAAVLTTRRLSLPEVGGDAVAYSDVDAASLAVELKALLDDPERRAELSAAASARAAGFTWAACASVHRRVFEEAAR